MNHFEELEQEVLSWPNVSVRPHRFGGREFRFGSVEIGHIHPGVVVDIPFPRGVRDALLADGLAEEHHWVPNSGWITSRIRSERRRQTLKVHPRSDPSRPLTGVFATRSPDRPNPIHRVTVRKIAKNRLPIGPMEAVDGTPIIDIKPVLCEVQGN